MGVACPLWLPEPPLCRLRSWDFQQRDIERRYQGNRVCLRVHPSSLGLLLLGWMRRLTQTPLSVVLSAHGCPPAVGFSMGTFSVTGTVEKIKERETERNGVLYKPSVAFKMNFSSFAASCKALFDCLETGQSTEQQKTETLGLEQSSASAGPDLSDVKWELRSTSRPLWPSLVSRQGSSHVSRLLRTRRWPLSSHRRCVQFRSSRKAAGMNRKGSQRRQARERNTVL